MKKEKDDENKEQENVRTSGLSSEGVVGNLEGKTAKQTKEKEIFDAET